MAKCRPSCGLVGDGCETDLLTSLHRVSCMHDVETLCIVAKALMVATESGCRLPVLFACALFVPLEDYLLKSRLLFLVMKPIPLDLTAAFSMLRFMLQTSVGSCFLPRAAMFFVILSSF